MKNSDKTVQDRELSERCKAEDRAAQRELYELLSQPLLAICYRYIGHRDQAEDLMHDAFIKIFGAMGKFEYRGEGSLRAWCERVTVNVALEALRHQKRLSVFSLDEHRLADSEPEPTFEAVECIAQSALMEMVAELPDGYRSVFNLYCVEGCSHREIAAALGINERSSSSQLARARKLLAQKVNDYLKQ